MRFSLRRLAAALCVTAALPATAATFVYVSNADSQEI